MHVDRSQPWQNLSVIFAEKFHAAFLNREPQRLETINPSLASDLSHKQIEGNLKDVLGLSQLDARQRDAVLVGCTGLSGYFGIIEVLNKLLHETSADPILNAVQPIRVYRAMDESKALERSEQVDDDGLGHDLSRLEKGFVDEDVIALRILL